MLLAIDTRVIVLNISFYVEMCFLKSENQKNYE